MAGAVPQLVVRVRKPLILFGPTPLGILSARPFVAIQDMTPEIPAYAVNPFPPITRGPSPKPTIPAYISTPRIVLQIMQDQVLVLAEGHEKTKKIHKPPPPPAAPIAPRRVIVAGYIPPSEIRQPIVVGAALPTSPTPVGAPLPFLRVVIVNPMADEAVQPIMPKPAWFSAIQPEAKYRPPGIVAQALDDGYQATVFPPPVQAARGVVPTPAPVGAPMPHVWIALPFDITPYLLTVPIIVTVVPVHIPGTICPGPAPRSDEACTMRGIADQSGVTYSRMQDDCTPRSRTDACCEE